MSLMLGDRVVARTLSDSSGGFWLQAPAPGTYSVAAQRVGYRDTRSSPIDLALGDTLTVEFRVLPQAILLEPMLVTATSRSGQAQFNLRMARGEGQFLTRDRLDALELWHPAQAFREVEGFHLRWGWGQLESGAMGVTPQVRSRRGSGCVGYLVDGVVAGSRFRSERGRNPWTMYPLDMLSEGEIMGIEFYRYVGEVPEELRHAARDALSAQGADLCGLVVIWTRAAW